MERFEIYEALTYGQPSVTSVCDDMPASFVVMFIGEGDTEEWKTGIWNTVYTLANGVYTSVIIVVYNLVYSFSCQGTIVCTPNSVPMVFICIYCVL